MMLIPRPSPDKECTIAKLINMLANPVCTMIKKAFHFPLKFSPPSLKLLQRCSDNRLNVSFAFQATVRWRVQRGVLFQASRESIPAPSADVPSAQSRPIRRPGVVPVTLLALDPHLPDELRWNDKGKLTLSEIHHVSVLIETLIWKSSICDLVVIIVDDRLDSC